MSKKPQRPTRAPRGKDANRKPGKKKSSIIYTEKVEFIDYKDVNLLNRFLSDRSKIRSRRVSATTPKQQREVATAIKNAREMALMPYTKRVATSRASRPSPAAEAVAAAEAQLAEVDPEEVEIDDDAADDGED
jgi:small subunit ribosomal protein S18